MTKRKMVQKEVDSLIVDYTSLGDILKSVKKMIASYGPDAVVEEKTYRYSDSKYLAVMKIVPETDEEMNTRIAAEERYKEQRLENDRALFEKLKAQFSEICVIISYLNSRKTNDY